jgi:hypothetical protein
MRRIRFPNTGCMVRNVYAFLIFYTALPGNLHELLIGVLGVDSLELGGGGRHQHGGQLTNRLLQVSQPAHQGIQNGSSWPYNICNRNSVNTGTIMHSTDIT